LTDSVVRLDLHVHTEYSFDGRIPIDKLVDICISKGLTGVAVTDHNTIEGALRLKEIIPEGFVLIVGEEILTDSGELIGYFLETPIPKGLSVDETIDRIKQQGGLVCVPHPFDRFRKSRLDANVLTRIIDKVDMIEGFNSRVILPLDNRRAMKFAKLHNLPVTAGSDAHAEFELGRTYVEMMAFNNSDEFLRNLRTAKLVTHRTGVSSHLCTMGIKFLRRRLKSKLRRSH